MKFLGVTIAIFVIIIAVSNIAAMVDHEKGLPDVFSRFFPEKFVDPEQEIARETLVAPFKAADEGTIAAEIDPAIAYDPLAGSDNVTETLEIPHRHEAAVSAWVTEAVTEILTFTLAGSEEHMRKSAILMSANGQAEFRKFLDETGVLGMMQTNGFDLRAFVKDIPQLRTSGAVQGRYKWVYDIPVNLTFLPGGTQTYEDLAAGQFRSESLMFRSQLTRVPTPRGQRTGPEGGRDGLVIETWAILPQQAAP